MRTFRRFNFSLLHLMKASPKPEVYRFGGHQYWRFNRNLLATVLMPLFFSGLFNVAIDPYGFFNTPNLLGINQSKPRKGNHDRLFKAIDIIRIKPITILMGSSRVRQGLNPNHSAFKNDHPVYNLGLNGVNPYEKLRYLKHTIANSKNLKLVIIGVDFFMFDAVNTNQPGFSESRLEKQNIILQDATSIALSLDALSSSVEALISSTNRLNEEGSATNGFMPYRNINLNKNVTEWRFKSSLKNYLELHPDYKLSTQYLADFKAIVDTCKQKGITLKVFISPAHATDREMIRATGHWSTLEKWERELVKIVPVWDFSNYNSITTERIKENMKYYADASHYREEVGDLVLNRLLSYNDKNIPNDFGVLVTSETIESHLTKISAEREVWAKNNDREVKLVLDVKHQQDRERRAKTK